MLVVDDLNTMTRIVDSMLRKCGFGHIEQVHDGRTALARLKTRPYQFVLSDREMPDMTGIDLVRAVRAEPRIAFVPIIMMSASTDPKDAEAAIAAGANTFITKPFSQTTLQDVIANLMRPRV